MKSFCQHLPLASLNKVIRFFRCCKINSLSILFYPVIVLLCLPQFMTNAQPANDNACNAINLSVGFNSPFTNVNATIQIGEPAIPTGTCTTQGNWCAGEPTPRHAAVMHQRSLATAPLQILCSLRVVCLPSTGQRTRR